MLVDRLCFISIYIGSITYCKQLLKNFVTKNVIICMIGMYDKLYFLLLYIWFGIEIYGI